MPATFNPDLSTPISRVRQAIGDTDIANALVQDETITYYLASKSELSTAAQLARDLAAKFAQDVDTTVDGQGERSSQRVRHFQELAQRLEREALAASPAVPASPTSFAGIAVFGTTAAEVEAARCDPTHPSNARLPFG